MLHFSVSLRIDCLAQLDCLAILRLSPFALYFVATSLLSGSWFVVRLLKTRTTSKPGRFTHFTVRRSGRSAVWVLAVRQVIAWALGAGRAAAGGTSYTEPLVQVRLYGQAAAAELCSV